MSSERDLGCEHVLAAHLLAGKLAQHRRDVAGVLSHLLLDGLLHGRRDTARHAGHDVLELQQWQGGVAHGFHQPLHPFFQLGQTEMHDERGARSGEPQVEERALTLPLKKGSGRQ